MLCLTQEALCHKAFAGLIFTSPCLRIEHTVLNSCALSYWKHRGYRDADLNEATKRLDHVHAARFYFKESGLFSIIASSRLGETKQGHLPAYTEYLREICRLWPELKPRGSLLMILEDGMYDESLARRVPVFGFARLASDLYSMLLPDPAFTYSHGYFVERKHFAHMRETLPWKERKPTIFWRGTSSGVRSDWQAAPRIRLAMACKEINDPEKIDAYISRVTPEQGSDFAVKLNELGLVRPTCPFEEFLRYRYLIEIDGEVCTWKSMFLKLSSGSLMIKVDSPYVQWYYDKLTPWVHYVPVRADLSDLAAIADWVCSHDEQCAEIAANAFELSQSITWESEIKESALQTWQILTYGVHE